MSTKVPSPASDLIRVTRQDGRVVEIPKLRLSPSKILVWQACQKNLKATLDATERDNGNIYSLVGTAVHEVYERINKGEVLDRENVLSETVQRLCVELDIGLEFPKSYKESNKTLQDYYPPEGWVLLSGEEKHVVDMGLYTFSYIIDSVWKHGDRYPIVDYKSSAAKPKTELQLQIYAWQVSRRLGIDPDLIDAYFWMTRNGQRIQAHIDKAVVARVAAYMAASVQLMYSMIAEEMEFPATPGDCYFCKVPNCTERI